MFMLRLYDVFVTMFFSDEMSFVTGLRMFVAGHEKLVTGHKRCRETNPVGIRIR